MDASCRKIRWRGQASPPFPPALMISSGTPAQQLSAAGRGQRICREKCEARFASRLYEAVGSPILTQPRLIFLPWVRALLPLLRCQCIEQREETIGKEQLFGNGEQHFSAFAPVLGIVGGSPRQVGQSPRTSRFTGSSRQARA